MPVKSISVQFTAAQRKAIAEMLPKLADRLKLDEKDGRTVSFTAAELEKIQANAQKEIETPKSRMHRNSLWHIIDAITKAIGNAQGIEAIPSRERLYQFKIILIESQPSIWRRIQVKNCTLDKLHERIQLAMGWMNSHLHEFEINGERYGDPMLLQNDFDDSPFIDSTIMKLNEILPKDGKQFQFLYSYDFGDDWRNEIVFEGCLQDQKGQRYPMCIEGARACPPRGYRRALGI